MNKEKIIAEMESRKGDTDREFDRAYNMAINHAVDIVKMYLDGYEIVKSQGEGK
jgi:hypothetical protein